MVKSVIMVILLKYVQFYFSNVYKLLFVSIVYIKNNFIIIIYQYVYEYIYVYVNEQIIDVYIYVYMFYS